MAGSLDPAEIPPLLERILYDEGFRQQLAERRRAVLGETTSIGEPRAASRSADALIELSQAGRNGTARNGPARNGPTE
jgi:hypothetical protein